MTHRLSHRIPELVAWLMVLLVILFFIFPLFYLATISVKFPAEFLSTPPRILPSSPTWMHFDDLINNSHLTTFFMNTAITSFGATLLAIILGTPAAYGLARLRFGGRAALASWILSTRLMPPIAVIMPIFLMFRTIGMLNNIGSLIILYTAFNLPFVIWMMLNFFRELPIEIEEAARIDGATRFDVFWRVALPLARPGLASTAIFCVIFSWNEFLFALILNNTPQSQTLSVAMALFVSEKGIQWGPMAALALTSSLPIMVFILLMRNQLARGLTLGAVKG